MELTIRLDLSNPELAISDLSEAMDLVKRLHRKANPLPIPSSATIKASAPRPRALSKPTLRLGNRAQRLFDAIVAEIEERGEATLESIAAHPEWNCTAASLRGTMMNAMRSVNHAHGNIPFIAAWDKERGCTVYTPKREN